MLMTGCGRGQPPPLSDHDQSVLAAYEQIRHALADDDFTATKKRALVLVNLVKPADSNARASSVQNEAQTMIDATALDRQRQAFLSLSKELVPLVKGRPGYYLFGSPLEPQAIWIQRDASPDNPYMGKVMRDSGSPIR